MAKKSSIISKKSAPLDQKFWANFSQNYWEKKHLHIQNFQSSLQNMDADEVFHLLVAYSDQCRKNKSAEGFKFYIQGLQTSESDILQVLPVKKDKTLLGYHARMQKMFSDYCLVCDELLSVESKHSRALTDFTDELYKHVGFSNRFSEMGLYLGNYQKTPFGVHVDRCGVFSFPVVGEKKFRLWTSEFVQKNPRLDRAFQYDQYKKSSQVLQAGPGDMTYWPSSAWHIAESNGEFSATWSLGVWVDRQHGQMFSEGLTDLIRQKNKPADQSTTTVFKNNVCEKNGEVRVLPEAFRESIMNIKKITSQELTEFFLVFWMKHVSLKGLKTAAHHNDTQRDVKVQITAKIRLKNLSYPILWITSPFDKNKIYICFGQNVIPISAKWGLFDMILRLNLGKTCAVKEYLQRKDLAPQLKLLNQLKQAGALI